MQVINDRREALQKELSSSESNNNFNNNYTDDSSNDSLTSSIGIVNECVTNITFM